LKSYSHDLTPRQLQCLHFIVQYTFERLYQPSIREIGEYMGIVSTNGVADHLKALRRKGYLGEQTKQETRALKFEDKALMLIKCSDTLRARPIIVPKEAK
jgi:repressor LexA